jgi:hypothetical protein
MEIKENLPSRGLRRKMKIFECFMDYFDREEVQQQIVKNMQDYIKENYVGVKDIGLGNGLGEESKSNL